MGFDKIGQFAAVVVIAAALAGNLDTLNRWVQVATAKLLWESRTSTWGSPKFWPEQDKFSKTTTQSKEVRNTKNKRE